MYRSDDFRTSTLLHSFVIFRVTETIFGMSGCFPVSQGQKKEELRFLRVSFMILSVLNLILNPQTKLRLIFEVCFCFNQF